MEGCLNRAKIPEPSTLVWTSNCGKNDCLGLQRKLFQRAGVIAVHKAQKFGVVCSISQPTQKPDFLDTVAMGVIKHSEWHVRWHLSTLGGMGPLWLDDLRKNISLQTSTLARGTVDEIQVMAADQLVLQPVPLNKSKRIETTNVYTLVDLPTQIPKLADGVLSCWPQSWDLTVVHWESEKEDLLPGCNLTGAHWIRALKVSGHQASWDIVTFVSG